MNIIEIYTKSYCRYCLRAKELLRIKGAAFTEHDITNDLTKEDAYRQRSNLKTVPGIFINDQLIGGCSELFELDEQGKLDHLLGLRPSPSG